MWTGKGEPDRRRKLFGGVGEVRVWSLLSGPAIPPFDCVLGCELDPGGTVGPHVQDRCDEIVIVTEGRGRARVGNGAVDLEPGVVVQVPLGQMLALVNALDDAPLRYLIIKVASSSS